MNKRSSGFTLIELLMTVAIIGILSSIAVAQYKFMIRKSEDGLTKANLGMLRSALAIYYTDNEAVYPRDQLNCLTGPAGFLKSMPVAYAMPSHPALQQVTAEVSPTDTGGWSYNNDSTSAAWGSVRMGCSHTDYSGRTWSSF